MAGTTADSETWSQGGKAIDISSCTGSTCSREEALPTSKPLPGDLSLKRFGYFTHGHVATSPERDMMCNYASSGSNYMGVNASGIHEPLLSTCLGGTCLQYREDLDGKGPAYPSGSNWASHCSWFADQDWYIAYSANSDTPTAPAKTNQKIWQVIYDPLTHTFLESNLLIAYYGATSWSRSGGACGTGGGTSINYGYTPHGSERKDGSLLLYYWNGGDYWTHDDYSCCEGSGCSSNYTNWRNNGAWIAELTPNNPADVNNDKSVNIKDIQACVKVITVVDLTYQNQCKVLAALDTVTNIKDIQAIVRAIIGG